jgi:soluble lytic murein transglycosylase-like protein
MIEPIFAQLQKNLYRALLEGLASNLNGFSANTSDSHIDPMKARSSDFDSVIETIAQQYELDPALLKAVVHAESNFSPTAISRAGAKGLMQLMDSTASQLGVTNSFDPVENLDGGARFLNQLLHRYNGNVALALAAYNAGPGAVDRWAGLPPYEETQIYVPRILGLRDQYREWKA